MGCLGAQNRRQKKKRKERKGGREGRERTRRMNQGPARASARAHGAAAASGAGGRGLEASGQRAGAQASRDPPPPPGLLSPCIFSGRPAQLWSQRRKGQGQAGPRDWRPEPVCPSHSSREAWSPAPGQPRWHSVDTEVSSGQTDGRMGGHAWSLSVVGAGAGSQSGGPGPGETVPREEEGAAMGAQPTRDPVLWPRDTSAPPPKPGPTRARTGRTPSLLRRRSSRSPAPPLPGGRGPDPSLRPRD